MRSILTGLALVAAALTFNGASASEGTDAAASAVNTCHAYTACWWGGTISCTTYGDACTWWVNPGVDVRCTGLDGRGLWVDVYFHC